MSQPVIELSLYSNKSVVKPNETFVLQGALLQCSGDPIICRPLTGRTITITQNGTVVATPTTDNGGSYSVAHSLAAEGSYPFVATYSGINSLPLTITVTTIKLDTTITLNVTRTQVEAGDLVNCEGNLTDENNTPVPYVDVRAYINNEPTNLVGMTTAEGHYYFGLYLGSGEYSITAVFEGTANLNPSTSPAVGVTVIKATTRIMFAARSTKEYVSNECKSLSGYCEPTWDANPEEVASEITTELANAIIQEFAPHMEEQGISGEVTAVLQEDVNISYRTISREFRDWTFVRKYATIEISGTILYSTDEPLNKNLRLRMGLSTKRLIEPTTMAFILIALKYALATLATIIFSYILVQAIFDWLKSMTTITATVIHYTHDDDPGSPTYCERVIDYVETSTEPAIDWTKIAIIVTVVGGTLAGLYFLTPLLGGKK